MKANKALEKKFVGCVACIYQDECNSNQFGLGCTYGKEDDK